MTKFKVGDRVKVIRATNLETYCYGLKGGEEYTITGISPEGNPRIRVGKNRECYMFDWRLELVAPTKQTPPVNFILQYKINEDEAETFENRKDVETRIKELAKRTDLERDSIKVYEIAKTYDVTLETRVLFGSNVTLTETPKHRNVDGKVALPLKRNGSDKHSITAAGTRRTKQSD